MASRFDKEHAWVEERLSSYVDGQLGSDERARVETHLHECAGCRTSLESLRWTISLLKQAPSPALPRSFTLPVPEKRAPASGFIFNTLRLGTAVAIVLLVGVIVADLFTPLGSSSSRVTMLAPAQDSNAAPTSIAFAPTKAPAPTQAPAREAPQAQPPAPVPTSAPAPTFAPAAGVAKPTFAPAATRAPEPTKAPEMMQSAAPTSAPKPAAVPPIPSPAPTATVQALGLGGGGDATTEGTPKSSQPAPRAATASTPVSPTATVTMTALPTQTIAPSATPTRAPTATAVPTLVAKAQAQPTRAPIAPPAASPNAFFTPLRLVEIGLLFGVIFLGALTVLLWRRR